MTDRRLRSGCCISLVLFIRGRDTLRLQGHVRAVGHSENSGTGGNIYRIGVEFDPFGERPECNSWEALNLLQILERNYLPRDASSQPALGMIP